MRIYIYTHLGQHYSVQGKTEAHEDVHLQDGTLMQWNTVCQWKWTQWQAGETI